MKAVWNGQIVAESNNIEYVDGNAYFPRSAMRKEFYKDSCHTSVCGWKGTARYWDLEIGGQTNQNAAWSYENPKKAAENIRERIAFWKGVKVTE
ncbi:hypothetical protein OMCYN_01848 [cyanobiont of Ornithocercus magnificus]|nr:hypothetical protein OMCYN_01848 [cyanobiont of Ornithocercus magnificus]